MYATPHYLLAAISASLYIYFRPSIPSPLFALLPTPLLLSSTKPTMSFRLSRSLASSSRPLLQFHSRTYAVQSVPQPKNALQESQPTAASPKPLQQSPNVPTTWSTSQNPKPHAFDNARFSQIRLDMQPNAPSAMGMVAEDPVRLVVARRAVCDGGKSRFGVVACAVPCSQNVGLW
jgi:NADH dehydrogenase (ubiquinone) Fe-S protein 6